MTKQEANQLIAVINGMVTGGEEKATDSEIVYCNEHGEPMELGTSKTKFNSDGTAKHYRFHKVDGKMCFGKGVLG